MNSSRPSAAARVSRRPASPRRSLTLERLEERTLLSVRPRVSFVDAFPCDPTGPVGYDASSILVRFQQPLAGRSGGQFLAGTTNWIGGSRLQYQLFNNGALVFSGYTGSLGNVNSTLKTIGFSGANGTLFDELRVQNIFERDFDAGETDRLILDNITIKAAALQSAVPEPATWAMMIIGFGAVGSMARSSRRRLAFAAA